ncbi:MAG: NapC/NirT family cytochrome c [Thermodesulfobacteriota bacterium]
MKVGSSVKAQAVVIITALVVIALAYGIKRAEEYSSSLEFCTSCHSMKYVYEDLKKSSHWGVLGINPVCGDCHLPPQITKRIWRHLRGVKELINEWRYDFSTREAFEAGKGEFIRKARESIRGWDSAPCRGCHKAPRPASTFGKAAHSKMRKKGLTCVDCHRGIFHGPSGA